MRILTITAAACVLLPPLAYGESAATSPETVEAARARELPPPVVVARIGDRCVTTFGIERETWIRLRGKRLLKQKLVDAGGWSEALEADWAKLRAAVGLQARSDLVKRALVAEMTGEAGESADEPRVEERLWTLARGAGGPEALVGREGRSLDGIRDELRFADLQSRFYGRFVPQDLGPGPGEVREHYLANRAAMKTPPSLKTRVIFIQSEQDPAAAFARADALRRELRNFDPGRFEERAREHSADRETAERGGLLVMPGDESKTGDDAGWVSLDVLARMNPAVAQVAQPLKPGAVSDVARRVDGFLLVKLDGIRPGREVSLGEAGERIAGELKLRRRQRLDEDWLDYYLGRAFVANASGRRLEIYGISSSQVR